uniref:Uncharacterized protein n=1 Tax=Molossus molossus TaxID=27622 RepID=A0A7J8J056_MOLMO|nr:hypothetical protein HJG59_010392 [Molossus molossus]
MLKRFGTVAEVAGENIRRLSLQRDGDETIRVTGRKESRPGLRDRNPTWSARVDQGLRDTRRALTRQTHALTTLESHSAVGPEVSPLALALVGPLRMLAGRANGLQLPEFTRTAERRSSLASTDTAANRQKRLSSKSQSLSGEGGIFYCVVPPQPVGVSATGGFCPAPSPGSWVLVSWSPER